MDEFVDHGHWTYQLYGRVARRMVSDYVMTEKNCKGTEKAPDSVGLIADEHDTANHALHGGDVDSGFGIHLGVAEFADVVDLGEGLELFEFDRKPPSVRRLNVLDLLGGDGQGGRFQAACGRSDLIAGWAARCVAAQVAGSRASSSHGRAPGRRLMTSWR